MVYRHTGAAGIMIGRAAQGRPWLGGQIDTFLETGTMVPDPTFGEIKQVLIHIYQDSLSFMARRWVFALHASMWVGI